MPEEMLPTAAEFEAAINRAAKENPEMVGQLIVTAVLSGLKRIEDHQAKLEKIAPAVVRLWQQSGLAVPQAGAAARPTNGAQARPANGAPRKSAVGEPLSPDEAAVEEMMDGAEVDNSPQPAIVAAVGQGPAQPRQTAQRMRATAGGAPPPPSNGSGGRLGGDGKPLTPEEEAMERMMDEAPVDNS